MQVEYIKALLFSYVNGELTEEERRMVEARCLADADLARELELTRATVHLLERRRPAQMKPFFWTRLSARLDEEASTQFAWIWVAKRLIPAMVATTLIVAVLLSPETDTSYAETSVYDSVLLAYETDGSLTQNTQEMTDDHILESVFFAQDTLIE
jgi:anti-sigma factor RsiW